MIVGMGSQGWLEFEMLWGMKADHVDVSWDGAKRKWLVRMEAGTAVIRRFCDLPKDAGEEVVRAAAAQTVLDEGYEFEVGGIGVGR